MQFDALVYVRLVMDDYCEIHKHNLVEPTLRLCNAHAFTPLHDGH
jgi:hypothetical protein